MQQLKLVAAALLAVAGIWFGYPGPGIYLAICIVLQAWPRPEEFELETPPFKRAEKAHEFKGGFLRPFGAPFGARLFAGPDNPGGFVPATRLSTWTAVPFVWLAAIGFATLPTAIPILDAAFVFLMWQGTAAGLRASGHPFLGQSFPAALLERDVVERVGLVKLVVHGAVGLVIGAVGGWYLATTLDAATATDWPWWTSPLLAVPLGAGLGLGAVTFVYTAEYLAPLKWKLQRSEEWAEIWMSVPKLANMPPAFDSEFRQPPEDTTRPDGELADETHRAAYFQTPSGGTIELVRGKTAEIGSAVAQTAGEAEYIYVAPMPKTDENGQVLHGTRQETMFGVFWNTKPLPDNAHLRTGLDNGSPFDNWTQKFVIHKAFDQAFRSLKLGMPDLVRVLPLHDMTTNNVLWETIWRLSPDVTFEKIIAKDTEIAEKIDADWLRVGRHTKDTSGGIIPESHVSVVFGKDPEHVTLSDPSKKAWLDALNLEAAFYDLKLGSPVLVETEQLSMPGHADLMESKFRMDSKVSWGDVWKKVDAIAENLDVDYLRITKRFHGNKASTLVSVIYGADPADTVLIGDAPDRDPDEIQEGEERSQLRLFLAGVDWDYWFRSCKLVGSDGLAPQPVAKYVNSQGVATYRMRTVSGLAVEDIEDKIEALMSSSGMGYIEVNTDADANYFQMLAAKVDPLDRDYLAVDYVDTPKPKTEDLTVLHDPIPGRPDINWAVGLGADGGLMVDRWEGDNPHLFVGGGSGSGKSVTVLSMILQMMHNNHPDDVKFALADPKTELGYFASAAHCNHFLGLTTPGFGENPFAALAELLSEMRDETYRRNTMLMQHPSQPQNLQQARFFARSEIEHARQGTRPNYWPDTVGFPWWDGEPADHPFMLPFQFIVIEECSTFFAAPPNKEQRPDWEQVLAYVSELARISRSAGIHLVTVTQYPVKTNIPTTVLAQSRRIGLPMNRVGSMLTIEEAGLEKLNTPGRGMMSQGKGFRGVRCLFVRVPDDKQPDIPDDRAAIFSRVMKQEGVASRFDDVDSDTVVAHGPTFVSAAPPSPEGLWSPRVQDASQQPMQQPPAEVLDLLEDLEPDVDPSGNTPGSTTDGESSVPDSGQASSGEDDDFPDLDDILDGIN